MYFSWLVFIALFTFAASTLYFYIFSRKQEKFMQYWGFSWIAYSMSLLCLLCFFVWEGSRRSKSKWEKPAI